MPDVTTISRCWEKEIGIIGSLVILDKKFYTCKMKAKDSIGDASGYVMLWIVYDRFNAQLSCHIGQKLWIVYDRFNA
jgi:hypothetical protein